MNRYPIILIALFAGNTLCGQQALTLRDAVLKAGTDYAPQRLRGLQWIEGTAEYSHVKDDRILRGSAENGEEPVIIDLARLNAALDDTLKLKALPAIAWLAPDKFRFFHNGRCHVHTLGTNRTSAVILHPGAANEDHHAGSGHCAFTVGNDLYVGGPGRAEPARITMDGNDGIVNGQSVHRQEYGITKGTFWSPGGDLLAFYRMDERMVSPYFLEDITTKPSSFDKIRYPMAGDTSHQVTVGVYDLRKGTTIFLKTGAPADQYLTNISWSHDGPFIHVVHLDRATENLRLVRYDARTGEPMATLLTERDSIYLEPEHPAIFLETRPAQFIWQSERDGWDHLYLYDTRDGSCKQLTQGRWVVKDVLGLDPTETFIVVEGTAETTPGKPSGATETHLYRVELTGKVTRLTPEPGTHHGLLSPDGRFILDTWSSLEVPGRIVLRDSRTGEVMKTLIDAKDPLAGTTVGQIELLTIPGEFGDQLNARLIKPSFFRKDVKYPVLIYVYNGPHVQLVTNSFLGGAALWMLEAAERGYLVWTVDGHGSAHRGRAFEQAIHRQLGEIEVRDQMRGVAHLEGLACVDAARMGVHGWSFGGHMTTAMLTRHPNRFKAGVAGGPVMDWGLYEVMYTERYMDTPAENPEGYRATNLTRTADQLKDHLLVITGGKDDTVLPQHTFTFIKACVDQGIRVDLFDYPGHGHNVRGKDRVHLMEKVLDYMDRHIRPSKG